MPEPTEPPDIDEPAPAADADLIAYLDGEVDGDTARAVESRLALDPRTRTKAEAYKKTYDLLDFLPKPEPSPDFTTRTVSQLSPVIPGLSSATLALDPVEAPTPSQQLPVRHGWPSGLGWLIAGIVAAMAGYGLHATAKPWFASAADANSHPPITDADRRAISHLALYLGVDDLDFARALAANDLFPPDAGPLDAAAPQSDPAPMEPIFAGLPTARRLQIRALDDALFALPEAERTSIFRTLASYSAWLDRLPAADRQKVFAATGPTARLEQIRSINEKRWWDGLPPGLRDELRTLPETGDRVVRLGQWKQIERDRNEEWALAKRQWLASPRIPDAGGWPFTDAVLGRQIDEYVRTVLKADVRWRPDAKFSLPVACRISREELLDLKSRYENASRDGLWLGYAAAVHRLAHKHPSLPEGKNAVTEPKPIAEFLRKLPKSEMAQLNRRTPSIGKWPEFALDVAEAAHRSGIALPENFAPSRPAEFPDATRQFIEKELLPALGENERGELKRLEGKWPDYPRAVIAAATKKDLPVPGVTLPGRPSLWEACFGEAAK